MPDWTILRESAELLGAVAVGWAMRARAPEGVEWVWYVRWRRKFWRRRVA